MSDQPTTLRHLADLSMSDFLLLAMTLCEEQGYSTPEGDLTPLGEEYLAALKAEEADRMTAITSEPPLSPFVATDDAPNRLDPSGGKEWSDLPDF